MKKISCFLLGLLCSLLAIAQDFSVELSGSSWPNYPGQRVLVNARIKNLTSDTICFSTYGENKIHYHSIEDVSFKHIVIDEFWTGSCTFSPNKEIISYVGQIYGATRYYIAPLSETDIAIELGIMPSGLDLYNGEDQQLTLTYRAIPCEFGENPLVFTKRVNVKMAKLNKKEMEYWKGIYDPNQQFTFVDELNTASLNIPKNCKDCSSLPLMLYHKANCLLKLNYKKADKSWVPEALAIVKERIQKDQKWPHYHNLRTVYGHVSGIAHSLKLITQEELDFLREVQLSK